MLRVKWLAQVVRGLYRLAIHGWGRKYFTVVGECIHSWSMRLLGFYILAQSNSWFGLRRAAPEWRTMVSLMAMPGQEHPNMRPNISTERSSAHCLRVWMAVWSISSASSPQLFASFSGEVLNLGKEVRKSLVEAFKKVDEEFLRKATEDKPTWKVSVLIPPFSSRSHFFLSSPLSSSFPTSLLLLQDGSTVAVVLVLDDVIYSANLGDSKAVLCRKATSEKNNQLTFVSLTKDHNPSNVSTACLF